ADRKLEIETRGHVPAPVVTPHGMFVERRWHVDLSPPAHLEPDSPPITEFLPSVRVGWGVSLESTLARLVDLAADETPLDPRLRAKALEIVGSVPSSAADERARLIYRWVVDHVQEDKTGGETTETDGRRVITGGTGSRQAAFRYMLRLLGIESELAIVKDRLAAAPAGKLSEMDPYDALVIRVSTQATPASQPTARWLIVKDKFAPYGYIPAEFRGQPAIRLIAGLPRDIVRAPGAADRMSYEGQAELHTDGSATMDLTVTFEGSLAIAWRSAMDSVPQAKLDDFVESQLVAPSFDGGRVRSLKVDPTPIDRAFVMHMRIDVPNLAKPVGDGLTMRPAFSPNLQQLATLPERHTALLRRASWHAAVRIRVILPDSVKAPARMPQGEVHDGDALVIVHDLASGHTITFDRVIELPAERIEPGSEYAAWQKFVRDADGLVSRYVDLPR
ncbi:MAG: hypothetical protein ACREJ3_06010, partial [Polyangiaceae bacterium]